jgi:hypothetical protein
MGNYTEHMMEKLPITKGDQHLAVCKKANETYRKKNADYGDSYGQQFQEYGPTVGIIYIENKIRRIKQLLKSPAQVQGESLNDSMDDLINYSIMLKMEMDNYEKH